MRLLARTSLLLVALHAACTPLHGRKIPGPAVGVDGQGVMRWTATGDEVALFGVNYTTPFAYAYRAHGYLGVSHREAIDIDVSHLARLGLDAYRVHVWDREISDRQGNLLQNEHLELLDYLIARLNERGIKTVLTPIFWGGPGYPERNPPTEGFSEDYAKGEMTVNPEARRVQQRYLQQFVQHVNPHTGRSYRDDPDIIAIELFNEPSHPGPPDERTRYINDLVHAVRETGFGKPLFYNVTIGWSDAHARAVCSAEIQGITFQWYPTGLVRGNTIRANMLPNVDGYPIPFEEVAECRDKARLVYEFDAADVMGSYMYPAMARSFRGAGMQWATQFSYDPLALAHANTEYQTHYLNLVYTPSKAISLLIAAEAFRRLPRRQGFGSYPRSARYGPFRISYEEDLSEVVLPEAFYHSNATDTRPENLAALRRIAGTGSSPVVGYEGRGAYFLDRLEEGVWRLEVYPDAVQVADPHGRASLNREVTRLLWREWPMQISLPDLGPGFSVRGVNEGNRHAAEASGETFAVRPGVYVLRRRGVGGARWSDPAAPVGKLRLGEFHVPVRRDAEPTVVHRPVLETVAGEAMVVRAEVVSSERPDNVELWARQPGSGAFTRTEMRRRRGIEYEAAVPSELLREGVLEYAIRVGAGEQVRTFPGGRVGGVPGDTLWQVPVAREGSPIVLFDVLRDAARILSPHPYRYVRFRSETVAGSAPLRRALRVEVEGFQPPPHHFAIRSFLGEEGRPRGANGHDVLRVRARSAGEAEERIEVALVQSDGTAWGAVVPVTREWQDIEVPLASLRPLALALLPRPYPEFLPNEWRRDPAPDPPGSPKLRELDGVQIRIGADLYERTAGERTHGFELERIVLERGQ